MVRKNTPSFQVIQSPIFVLDQKKEWFENVRIIAGDWDRPRQGINDRRLILQRWDSPELTDSIDKRWMITISGSPNRGSVIVPEQVGDFIRLSTNLRRNRVVDYARSREVCRSMNQMLREMLALVADVEVAK